MALQLVIGAGGGGGIFRDEKGDLVLMCAHGFGDYTNTAAEILALLQGLHMCCEGQSDIIVEVKWIESGHTYRDGNCVAYELLQLGNSQERGRPKGSMKRTKLFLASHTKQDGTFPEQIKDIMARINRLIENEPEIMEKDLDHDPIALVYEEDGNGKVRGFSGHINKFLGYSTFEEGH
ncbi:hypothetical protein GIB67_013959 [Kingdonia uniflora]|uniref:RNase H type-1 domain-containing protein n=1 Tax=Kingdonia uniflora TaxID=39325 RepID=A0A7J7LDC4_9MAGN|nr:hypothetical protein GIB67_013959 [Kingdonia uniflora]